MGIIGEMFQDFLLAAPWKAAVYAGKQDLNRSLLLHRACCYIYFIQTNSCTLFKIHSHLKD